MDEIDRLISEVPREDLEKISKSLSSKKGKKKTHVSFPKIETKTKAKQYSNEQTCASHKDAEDFLALLLIQDLDKRPTASIKAQLIEGLLTFAEIMDEEQQKKRFISRAIRIVTMDRDYLINSIVSMIAV